MRKYHLFFILTIIVIQTLSAQRIGLDTFKRTVEGPEGYVVVNDHYFEPNFTAAFISNDDSNTVYKLRYNAFYDEIEIEHNGQILFLNKEENLEVFFRELNKNYVCLRYSDGKDNVFGYLAVVYQGQKYKVLVKENVELFIGNKTDMTRGGSAEQYRKMKLKYFIKTEIGFFEMPNSKKKFAALFKGKEKAILDYMKSNKISLNDFMDIRKLFLFIEKMN